jgi:glycopeptide antibiotics resistance protein
LTSRRTGKSRHYRNAAIFMFTGYSLFLGYLLFFGFSRVSREVRMMNLIPFKTISNYFIKYHYFAFDNWVINLFGNVAAFIPLGWLAPLVFTNIQSYRQIFLRFVVAVLIIEMVQWVFKVGSFDVDDIMLNVLGGMIGYAMLRGLRRRKEQWRK